MLFRVYGNNIDHFQIFNHIENLIVYSLQDEDTLNYHLPVTQIRFPVFPLKEPAIEADELLASCK